MKPPARPLSPHLQVYRPQLTSVLSITHRASGLALVAGTVLLVWWLVAAATGPEAFARFQRFAGSWLGVLLLLGWSFALFWHLSMGIRHLIWDTGWGLDIPTTYRSGWIAVGVATLLTLIAWIAGFSGWRG
jgi:succinate dehydrogenase / fumarate reductase cytochrome b subunit